LVFERIGFDGTLVHELASARGFVGNSYNPNNLVLALVQRV
jgi:hypothetical protein